MSSVGQEEFGSQVLGSQSRKGQGVQRESKAIKEMDLRRPVILNETDTMRQAALAMERNNIGSVLVAEVGGEISALVTDRDLALTMALEEVDCDEMIGAALTGPLITVSEEGTLDDVVAAMKRHSIRRVPVMKSSGHRKQCLGILTLDDLVKADLISREDEIAIISSQVKPRKEKVGQTRTQHLFRSQERKQHTANRFLKVLQEELGLSSGQTKSFCLQVTGFLLMRIPEAAGKKFLAQFPSELQKDLLPLVSKTDRSLTAQVLLKEVASRYHLEGGPEEAALMVHRYFNGLSKLISQGDLENLRNQLPKGARHLFA